MKRFLSIFSFFGLLCFGFACSAEKSGLPEYKNISPQAAYELLQSHPNTKTLDIRTDTEFAEGHIEGAVQIDCYADTFSEQLAKLDKGATYVLHCRSGGRSGKSIRVLQELGFTNIVHLNSGMKGWLAEGLPVVK